MSNKNQKYAPKVVFNVPTGAFVPFELREAIYNGTTATPVESKTLMSKPKSPAAFKSKSAVTHRRKWSSSSRKCCGG